MVCASYLAKSGFEVTILERRSIVGGAAVTEEFHPGFKNSTASYTVSLLHPEIIHDLNLKDHGLQILPRRAGNYLPLPNGDSFASYSDTTLTMEEVRRHSPSDVTKLMEFNQLLSSVVPVIKEQMLKAPPQLSHPGLGDLLKIFKMSRSFNHLKLDQKEFLFNLFTRSPGEILEDYIDSEVVQSWLGFDAMVGHYASPYHPGSGYVLLHHHLGEVAGISGAWGHAVGGMGAITQTMATEAKKRGVKIVVDAEVEQILVEKNKANAVLLTNGETLKADIIVANVDPKLLFLKLVEPNFVPDNIRHHFERFKCQSGTFRMNLALSELPDFKTRPSDHYLESGIIIAPNLSYMNKAYNDARSSGWSENPIIEMLIPSIIDKSLVPPDQHVASLFCQHFDPFLKEGWDKVREKVADQIISCLSEYAPNLANSILARQIHSPKDIEDKFGMTGGDIFHGRLSLDQLFSARPMIGMSQYQTHISNLFMCGSGTHPGGGVSGIPGHNSAQAIIKKYH